MAMSRPGLQPTVKHVPDWRRQHIRTFAAVPLAEAGVVRNARVQGGGATGRHRDTQDGVRAELRLRFGAIQTSMTFWSAGHQKASDTRGGSPYGQS